MDFRLVRLNNGLQVVTAPMPGMYSAAISVFVHTGSRNESLPQAGAAHLIEHMLFKGTDKRPNAEAISETIERVGGAMNASTDKELTVYWVKVAANRTAIAADLLADMLLNSKFEQAEVKKEQRVVLEELGMSMDSPQDWVHSLIDEQAWPGTALGRDVAGTKDSIAGLRRDVLLDFMQHWYDPESTVLAIAGAIEHEEALAIAEASFGSWQARSSHAAVHAEVEAFEYQPHPPSVLFDSRDTEQINMCLATRGVSHASEDRYAFDLLVSILGGAMSSRLFLEVRERRGLAYDIHSYSNKLFDTGSMVTYMAVDPRNSREAIEEVLRQLSMLRDQPVSHSELEKAKDYSKGRLLLGLEDTQSVSGWCGVQQLVYGEIRQPTAVCALIDAVTPDDVQRLAHACFREEYLRLVALGPQQASQALEGVLHL